MKLQEISLVKCNTLPSSHVGMKQFEICFDSLLLTKLMYDTNAPNYVPQGVEGPAFFSLCIDYFLQATGRLSQSAKRVSKRMVSVHVLCCLQVDTVSLLPWEVLLCVLLCNKVEP